MRIVGVSLVFNLIIYKLHQDQCTLPSCSTLVLNAVLFIDSKWVKDISSCYLNHLIGEKFLFKSVFGGMSSENYFR